MPTLMERLMNLPGTLVYEPEWTRITIMDGRIVSSNGTPQENAQAMADFWQARAIKAEGKDSWALEDSQPPSHGV